MSYKFYKFVNSFPSFFKLQKLKVSKSLETSEIMEDNKENQKIDLKMPNFHVELKNIFPSLFLSLISFKY